MSGIHNDVNFSHRGNTAAGWEVTITCVHLIPVQKPWLLVLPALHPPL